MALQFGLGVLTVTGTAIARLMNLNFTVSYDVAHLRGGSLIFPTHQSLYNGAIEGSFEVGEIALTAIAGMLGAQHAGAATSGTMKITATHVLASGKDIQVSAITNGVTGTLTFKNCRFNTLGVTVDRENYTMPTTNFVVCGDSNGELMTWQI